MLPRRSQRQKASGISKQAVINPGKPTINKPHAQPVRKGQARPSPVPITPPDLFAEGDIVSKEGISVASLPLSPPRKTSLGDRQLPKPRAWRQATPKPKATRPAIITDDEVELDVDLDDESPLFGFGDQTVSTIDEPLEPVNANVLDLVTSWQAQTANPPHTPIHQRRPIDPLSSPLPPSSPPPPLSPTSSSPRDSEMGLSSPAGPSSQPPSSSDPFGFFAVEKQIQAKRNRNGKAKQKSPSRAQPPRTPSPSLSLDDNLKPEEEPFADYPTKPPTPAFSYQEDPVSGMNTPPPKSPVRKRSLRHHRSSSPPEEQIDTEKRNRRGKGKGKAVVDKEISDEDEDLPKRSRVKTSTRQRAPKATTAKATRRTWRGARRSSGDAKMEKVDLSSLSGEDTDDSGKDHARKVLEEERRKRLEELKALDNYQLAEEKVIVF